MIETKEPKGSPQSCKVHQFPAYRTSQDYNSEKSTFGLSDQYGGHLTLFQISGFLNFETVTKVS